MNFTAGIILLFLNVFIPGFLFLRFYFTGEFSKQFTTRVPLLRLSFYALIPGFIFQLIGLSIYDWWDTKFTIFDSLQIFRDLMKNVGDYSNDATHFLKYKIYIYVCYTSAICLFAIILGFFTHWLIRRFDLDINYKILRFRNHWYYVFSGDILRFEKYKLASVNLQKQTYNVERGIMMTFADLLVNNNGQTKKYSGYVMDYELDSNNIQNLSKIYLVDVQKYDYTDKSCTEYEKKDVPGDVFIIEYKDVINMNVTYVPSIHKIEKSESKKEKRRKRLFSSIGALAFLMILFVFIQFAFLIIEIPYFNDFMIQFGVLSRVLFFLSIVSLLAIISIKKENSKLNSNMKEVGPLLNNDVISVVDEIKTEEELKLKEDHRNTVIGVWALNIISLIIIVIHYIFYKN